MSRDWKHGGTFVTIDPEDRHAVERLRDLMDAATFDQTGHRPWSVTAPGRGNALQAALREFAKPTPSKPVEPTGLGAVVEDADGTWWLRTYESGAWPWRKTDRTSVNGVHAADDARGGRPYADIAAVKVLSEGVTA